MTIFFKFLDHGPKKTDPIPIMLVPQICHMTGLTDQHRSDFKVKTFLACERI
jgi:hypothetical protein